MYLAKKPGARVSPIAFGRRLRNTQRLRRLLDCHADEIPEFDQFRLACVVGGKTVECLVHGELFVFIAAGRGDLHGGVVDADPLQSTPVTNRFLASSVVNNDASHVLGRDSEEMGAPLPLPTILASKLEPCLVHQGGGLEGLSGSFTGKLGGGEMAKFVVNQRQESLSGLGLTRLDRGKNFRGLVNTEVNLCVCESHNQLGNLANTFALCVCTGAHDRIFRRLNRKERRERRESRNRFLPLRSLRSLRFILFGD